LAQNCALKMHTSPAGHPSSSSQPGAATGTHAPRQSSHLGQLEVAQALQIAPGPQDAQEPGSHAGTQVPVAKWQSAPGQSSWVSHGPAPVLVVVPFVVVEVAEVDEEVPDEAFEAVPPPPVPGSATTLPPHAQDQNASATTQAGGSERSECAMRTMLPRTARGRPSFPGASEIACRERQARLRGRARYSPPTQPETQFSHPQHDPVRHSWQNSNPLAHGTSSLHAAVQ
jgi:hypothetical protein